MLALPNCTIYVSCISVQPRNKYAPAIYFLGLLCNTVFIYFSALCVEEPRDIVGFAILSTLLNTSLSTSIKASKK